MAHYTVGGSVALNIPSRHSHLPSSLLSSPFLVQKIYVCREAVRANLIALPCRHQRVGWDCRVKSTNSSPDHPNMRSTSWVLSNRPSFYDFSLVQSIFLKTNLWLTTFHWPEKLPTNHERDAGMRFVGKSVSLSISFSPDDDWIVGGRDQFGNSLRYVHRPIWNRGYKYSRGLTTCWRVSAAWWNDHLFDLSRSGTRPGPPLTIGATTGYLGITREIWD